MPEFSKETERQDLSPARFIRVGDTILFSNDFEVTHKELAEEHGVNETVKVDGETFFVVDDGGWINLDSNDKLKFNNSTSSTKVRGSKHEAREKTISLAKSVYGDENVNDSYDL